MLKSHTAGNISKSIIYVLYVACTLILYFHINDVGELVMDYNTRTRIWFEPIKYDKINNRDLYTYYDIKS